MSCIPSSDILAEFDNQDISFPDQFDPSFSDDLEALHAQQIDIAAKNNRQGIVIQHRSWPLTDAFRSDDDRTFGEYKLHVFI